MITSMGECFLCKGPKENGYITHPIVLKDCVIIVKNVPAQICSQCGESTFITEVVSNLVKISGKLESIIKEVAIIDYAESVA